MQPEFQIQKEIDSVVELEYLSPVTAHSSVQVELDIDFPMFLLLAEVDFDIFVLSLE